MTTRITTPASAMPVTLDAAKLSLKEDGSDRDALITAWIQGITDYVEHYTGRSLINRQMRVTLDTFPVACKSTAGSIRLDCPPIVSVEAINYIDTVGAAQTLDPQDYFADIVSEPGWAVIAPNKTWPATLDRINCVTCDYTAGYGADSDSIPVGIKLYILAKLAEQFDQGGWPIRDTVRSSFIDRLLDPFKMYT